MYLHATFIVLTFKYFLCLLNEVLRGSVYLGYS